MNQAADIERVLAQEHARLIPLPSLSARIATAVREFLAVGEDRYRMSIAGIGIEFEIDRLRRERYELIGELCVRCDLPGARTVDRVLSAADFNVSSARSRIDRRRTPKLMELRVSDDSGAVHEGHSDRQIPTRAEVVDLAKVYLAGKIAEDHLDAWFQEWARDPTIVYEDGHVLRRIITTHEAGHTLMRLVGGEKPQIRITPQRGVTSTSTDDEVPQIPKKSDEQCVQELNESMVACGMEPFDLVELRREVEAVISEHWTFVCSVACRLEERLKEAHDVRITGNEMDLMWTRYRNGE